MRKSEFEQIIQESEDHLRGGDSQLVFKKLAKISPRNIPDSLRFQMANIARRSGMYGFALKALNPIVVKSNLRRPPSTDEVAEYCVSLHKVGATPEALKRLSEITEETPSVHLNHAICLFSQWKYADAIPLLERYIASPNITDYQRLVGQVNLAAANVILVREKEAQSLLSEIRYTCESENYQRLLGNTYELSAQLSIYLGHFEKTTEYLLAAQKCLHSDGSTDLFFVKKWTSIHRAITNHSLLPLKPIADEASRIRSFETLREIDFFSQKVHLDKYQLNHLYFGTPFQWYRDRIHSEFHGDIETQDFFLNGKGSLALDIQSGQYGGRRLFKYGSQLHRLMIALLSDLYTPSTVGSLFSNLYHEEYYDPYSSLNRVCQLIFRLRKTLENANIKLPIEQTQAGFAINPQFTSIRLVKETSTSIEIGDDFLNQLEKQLQGQEFTSKQASRLINLSTAQTNRWIKKSLEEGTLIKLSCGPRTKYKLKNTA